MTSDLLSVVLEAELVLFPFQAIPTSSKNASLS